MGRKNQARDLKYETKKYIYDFQKYEMRRSFVLLKLIQLNLKRIKAIYQMIQQNVIINLDQNQKKVKIKIEILMKMHMLFMRELTLKAFKSGIFSTKATQDKGLKI